MFIDDQDVETVTVFYRKAGNGYEAYTSKEIKKVKLSDKALAKFQTVNIKARIMTWGMYNDLQESSTVIDPEGNRRFNYKIYKENRLKKIIQGWDAKDKNGKVVDVNESSLNRLSPAVAEAIIRALDEIGFVSEEEENLS